MLSEHATYMGGTLESYPPEYGRTVRRNAGWDEKTPILAFCPILPFVWPVKASLAKYLALATTGAYKDSQYRTAYFHKSGPTVVAENSRYLSAFARATSAFLQRHKVFPILVAMERLDARACSQVAADLGGASVPG